MEGGFDLAVGRVLQLQVTAFDQLASGLIQRVALPVETPRGRRAAFPLQNLGEISNRGWEVQGSALLGSLSLEGAFSRVDSRVRRPAISWARPDGWAWVRSMEPSGVLVKRSMVSAPVTGLRPDSHFLNSSEPSGWP